MPNYTQCYTYDKSTNLLNNDHIGTRPNLKQQLVVQNSNRLANANYDPSGNQLWTEGSDQITYNHEGQITLTKRTDKDKNTISEYYTYANQGQRIKKVTQTSDLSGLVKKIDIVSYVGPTEYRKSYAGNNLYYNGITVTENGQKINTLKDNVETRVKTGHGQAAKITDDLISNTNSPSYYLVNNIGNNSVELESTSNFINYQAFYPYGMVNRTTGNANNKQLGFSGQELDSTNLNYYGFRYYDSAAGRWTRPDPIGFESGQLNLYSMVDGNPVTSWDDDGLMLNEAGLLLVLKNYMRKQRSKNLSANFKIISSLVNTFYQTYYLYDENRVEEIIKERKENFNLRLSEKDRKSLSTRFVRHKHYIQVFGRNPYNDNVSKVRDLLYHQYEHCLESSSQKILDEHFAKYFDILTKLKMIGSKKYKPINKDLTHYIYIQMNKTGAFILRQCCGRIKGNLEVIKNSNLDGLGQIALRLKEDVDFSLGSFRKKGSIMTVGNKYAGIKGEDIDKALTAVFNQFNDFKKTKQKYLHKVSIFEEIAKVGIGINQIHPGVAGNSMLSIAIATYLFAHEGMTTEYDKDHLNFKHFLSHANYDTPYPVELKDLPIRHVPSKNLGIRMKKK